VDAYPVFPRQSMPKWAVIVLSCLGATFLFTLIGVTVLVLRDPALRGTKVVATPVVAPVAAPAAPVAPAAVAAPAVEKAPQAAPEATAAPKKQVARKRAVAHHGSARHTNVAAAANNAKGKAHKKDDELDRILGL
jgi:hypothetical protein